MSIGNSIHLIAINLTISTSLCISNFLFGNMKKLKRFIEKYFYCN